MVVCISRPLHQIAPATYLHGFRLNYRREPPGISWPILFAVLLALAKEIKQLQESEDNLLKQKSEGKQKETAQTQIIPVAQHILESYPILSLEERDRLWKLVLKKATIYRSPDNEVTIRIYTNLPR